MELDNDDSTRPARGPRARCARGHDPRPDRAVTTAPATIPQQRHSWADRPRFDPAEGPRPLRRRSPTQPTALRAGTTTRPADQASPTGGCYPPCGLLDSTQRSGPLGLSTATTSDRPRMKHAGGLAQRPRAGRLRGQERAECRWTLSMRPPTFVEARPTMLSTRPQQRHPTLRAAPNAAFRQRPSLSPIQHGLLAVISARLIDPDAAAVSITNRAAPNTGFACERVKCGGRRRRPLASQNLRQAWAQVE